MTGDNNVCRIRKRLGDSTHNLMHADLHMLGGWVSYAVDYLLVAGGFHWLPTKTATLPVFFFSCL